jgi:hypothetical protein
MTKALAAFVSIFKRSFPLLQKAERRIHSTLGSHFEADRDG